MSNIFKMSVDDVMFILGEKIAEDYNQMTEDFEDEQEARNEMKWFCNEQLTESVHQSALGKFNELRKS